MKAFLKNYRQSPRKVRLVATLVKGKPVADALISLQMLTKRASTPLHKLLLSAVANAKSQGLDVENLFIKEFSVDKGIVMKRMMPRAMGRGARINKRTSHVTVVLGERAVKTKKVKAEKAPKSKVVTKKPKAKANK